MDRNKCNVLIVDDSSFSRISIRQELEASDFKNIFEAESAKDALEILKTQLIDLAIIDVVMPEISGIELTKTISKSYPKTQIIVISSLGQENIVLDSITAGAQDFIQKPIKKESLLSSIFKIFENYEKV